MHYCCTALPNGKIQSMLKADADYEVNGNHGERANVSNHNKALNSNLMINASHYTK